MSQPILFRPYTPTGDYPARFGQPCYAALLRVWKRVFPLAAFEVG